MSLFFSVMSEQTKDRNGSGLNEFLLQGSFAQSYQGPEVPAHHGLCCNACARECARTTHTHTQTYNNRLSHNTIIIPLASFNAEEDLNKIL